jgi:hypothetical protein
MIDCVYYNDKIRCYKNGVVERWWRGKFWKLIENTANNNNGYNNIGIDNKMIKRHRLIAFCFKGLNNIKGERKNDDIDHIDGNTLNNSANNLRIVSNQQNCFNRTKAKGYSLYKRNNKWRSHIVLNGKKIHLGLFKNENDAREAYLNAKRIYHII